MEGGAGVAVLGEAEVERGVAAGKEKVGVDEGDEEAAEVMLTEGKENLGFGVGVEETGFGVGVGVAV